MKAKREATSPKASFRQRILHLDPTVEDLSTWVNILTSAPSLAVDVETRGKQVTCIGFAPSPTEAYVIPFWNKVREPNYWTTPEEEVFAWKAVKKILEGPSRKIFQNGLYDIQYCLHHCWYPQNVGEDTMLKFHALYPALPKGLDFLGSLYCNERAWKRFRPRGGEEKREA
jgi:DNA polymerase I-like protein with 3'-5' exonuclease and polymerase domains